MLTDGLLLLKPSFATDYFSKVDHYTSPKNAGKIEDFLKEHYESKIAAAKDIYSFDGKDARIRINGPLSVEGPDLFDIFYGYVGVSYSDIVEATLIAAEDVDSETGKVYFDFNTPGGTVDGVDKTFQAISALSVTHQTIAENHGDIASAGMWLASGCRVIVAKTPVAFTGSIGVVVAGFDISQMLEEMGVKKVVITNHEASDKWPDITTEAGQQIIRDELDAIYNVFTSRVLSGRPNMTRADIDRLKGTMKVAKDALDLGLIDSISGVDVVKPPAAAGKPKEEAAKMSLKELLAADPGAKAEYDVLIASAEETGRVKGETAGKTAGKDEMKATIAAASPYLANEAYPTLGAMALKVITGEETVATLTVSVTAIDALKEQNAAELAKLEAAGETVPAAPNADKSQENYQAKKDRLKEA